MADQAVIDRSVNNTAIERTERFQLNSIDPATDIRKEAFPPVLTFGPIIYYLTKFARRARLIVLEYKQGAIFENSENRKALSDYCDYERMYNTDFESSIEELRAKHDLEIELLARSFQKTASEVRILLNKSGDTNDNLLTHQQHEATISKNEEINRDWSAKRAKQEGLSVTGFIMKYYAHELAERRLTRSLINKDVALAKALERWEKDNPEESLGFEFVRPTEIRDRDEKVYATRHKARLDSQRLSAPKRQGQRVKASGKISGFAAG